MTGRSSDSPPEEIQDDEVLTQYVFNEADPPNAPRPQDADGLSMLRGKRTTLAAAKFVRVRVRFPSDGDAVRWVTAGALRGAGFEVTATPTRRNPLHVSVSREASWGENECSEFDGTFEPDTDTYEYTEGGEPQ
ncbi:hypothetical protein GCM10027596_35820 [Nocardioides korecus]